MKMPHVIVKMHIGRTEEQKQLLAKEITRAVVETINSSEEKISVSIEEFLPEVWEEQVVIPDVLEKPHLVYKKLGEKMPED
jgi:4-oxalocrotonate tautomerase